MVHALADVTLRGNDVWGLGQKHIEDNHVHDMMQVGTYCIFTQWDLAY